MSKQIFKVPFAYCGLDRAARFLNQFINPSVEIDDLLHFAELGHIKLSSLHHLNSRRDCWFSDEKLNILKSEHVFEEGETLIEYKLGKGLEERTFTVFIARAESAKFDGEYQTLVTTDGKWPLELWDIKRLLSSDRRSLDTQIIKLSDKKTADGLNITLEIDNTIRLESLIIFSGDLYKVYRHLSGQELFDLNNPECNSDSLKLKSIALAPENIVNERVRAPIADLVYGLIALIYGPDNDLIRHSTKLYNDLVGKLVRHTPSIDTEIMSERAFNELMLKIQIQRNKSRG